MTSPIGTRKRFWSGDVLFGGWSIVQSTFVVEILAVSGYDWIGIDTHHGLWSSDQIIQALQAADARDVPCLVRVNGPDPWAIMRVLDLGASGVIIPMVDSPEEAEIAVAACRYPPDGRRSFGPIRASLGSTGESALASDAAVVCLVMIETREGLDRIEEIIAVPGIDGVLVGPVDLALTHGLPPSATIAPGRHQELVERVMTACRDAKIPVGITSSSPAATQEAIAAGASFVVLNADAALLSSAARSEVADHRGSGNIAADVVV